jgi:hypothetical protein
MSDSGQTGTQNYVIPAEAGIQASSTDLVFWIPDIHLPWIPE